MSSHKSEPNDHKWYHGWTSVKYKDGEGGGGSGEGGGGGGFEYETDAYMSRHNSILKDEEWYDLNVREEKKMSSVSTREALT